jgi:RimJ/RimL family protein N-acetyltransferase
VTRTDEHGLPVGEPVPEWTPRARPGAGPFVGRNCSVVPLTADHADALYPTCAAPGTEHLWTYLSDGPFPDPAEFRERIAGTVADPTCVSVAVVLPDGTPAGLANFMRIDEQQGSVEVGGILLGTALRRTPAATEALHLMAAHVFEDLGYRRYEWKCDALNEASVRAARRLGFRYEGNFRNAVVYKGRNRDTAWFSITDDEWPAVAAAQQAWLDPRNFDANGRQRRPLRPSIS